MAFIEVEDVSHAFPVRRKHVFQKRGLREVLKSISFSVEKGEIVGLTGANGVGKTTLIRIICGVLRPNRGVVRIDGMSPVMQRREVAGRMGVLLVKPSQLYEGVTVRTALEGNRFWFGMEEDSFWKRCEYYTQLLEISEVLDRKMGDLSLGQRRSVELLDILLHEPEILLLDEPTIGVDLTVKETIRSFLLQLNRTQDLTVLLTSHDKRDIDMLCRRVLALEDGGILREVKG